jgi:hypothetical protein
MIVRSRTGFVPQPVLQILASPIDPIKNGYLSNRAKPRFLVRPDVCFDGYPDPHLINKHQLAYISLEDSRRWRPRLLRSLT